ncbi:hypothetical protein [Oribacterium sp. WCC10]|nr:hypothetical protein [Oribacterium sp. WCC10]
MKRSKPLDSLDKISKTVVLASNDWLVYSATIIGKQILESKKTSTK